MISSIDPSSLPEPFRSRILVWRETERICQKLTRAANARQGLGPGRPPLPDTRKVRFDAAWNVDEWRARVGAPKWQTVTAVVDQDTLVAAGQLVAGFPDARVAVLNLADDGYPGGCVYTGSGAQEESLFRRTTLQCHLPIVFYPIEADAALYSRDVVVLRDAEANGHAWLPPASTFRVDVVSCPGLRHPQLTPDGGLWPADRERLLTKVRLIYRCCAENRATHLVLGALGCGAWRCPPTDVAAVFRTVNDEFAGTFSHVLFAILPVAGQRGGDGNAAAFRAALA
jgi:uncharacterized protein (TIGR02452 family)